MYQYETHLHTFPVSKCGKVGVRENLEFYKNAGYAGVFITNHFIDGNMSPCEGGYAERINFYFSDYEEAAALASEIGIAVFCGVEISYKGTDFLIYGLDKAWFLAHPEYETMRIREKLALLRQHGALVIQAHPFREDYYIDHIRLYPRDVVAIETYNACRTDVENTMAAIYAEKYQLLPFSGTDNHIGAKRPMLGGMASETPIIDEADFIQRVLNGTMSLIHQPNPLYTEE